MGRPEMPEHPEHEEHTMDEYEVTITSAREEYRYLVDADSEQSAQDQGEASARQDGWAGFGFVAVRCMSR